MNVPVVLTNVSKAGCLGFVYRTAKGGERVEALVENWKKTSILLGKFLMLPSPTKLLCDYTVSGCLGASEMIPKSKEERKKAIDQLILYMKLHEEALEFGVKDGSLSLSKYLAQD